MPVFLTIYNPGPGATTYTVNNGHSVLAAMTRFGDALKNVERPDPEVRVTTGY